VCSIIYYTQRKEAPMEMSAIEQRQRDIMREMEQIQVMKKGSVTFQRYRDRGQGSGLYPVLTWKEQGRTKSMRLKTPAEVAWAENAVANYKRFTELRCAYERLAEERALHGRDEMAAGASREAQKKGLKSPRRPRPK